MPLSSDPAQTLLLLFDHLDERRYDDLAALFTPDGLWHRQGRTLKGRAQIRAVLEERSPTQRIRHLVTNVLQRSADADALVLTNHMLALRHDDGRVHEGPVTIAGPLKMSMVTTRLVRVQRTWLVAEQMLRTEFDFAGA